MNRGYSHASLKKVGAVKTNGHSTKKTLFLRNEPPQSPLSGGLSEQMRLSYGIYQTHVIVRLALTITLNLNVFNHLDPECIPNSDEFLRQ